MTTDLTDPTGHADPGAGVIGPEGGDSRPWEQIEQIAEAGDADRLEAYVDSLTAGEAARAMAHLDADDRTLVLETLTAVDAADLIEELPVAQAADLIEQLPVGVAAAIVHELRSDEQADIMAEVRDEDADAILAELDPSVAHGIRELVAWDENVAGGLMVTELLRFRASDSVADVIANLRERAADYADYDIQYTYVTDHRDRLVGVLRMRDLLLAPGSRSLRSIMVEDPVAVDADAPLEEVADLLERRAYLAVPVVDAAGRLLGVVRRSSVREAESRRMESDHLKVQGIVGGEELRTMPLLQRSRRRLSWLSVNIVLNVIAASVIAFFEETLAAVIALAFFLPIISDMSGCSGNQAVAVSIRELTLGLVRPHELAYVWLKEIGVGIVNGVILGGLIGVVAFIWKGNAWLGLVVGAVLAANTMVAVSIGGAVPLILKRFGMDPALASGPILTTITDICGFLFVLGLATLLLTRLLA